MHAEPLKRRQDGFQRGGTAARRGDGTMTHARLSLLDLLDGEYAQLVKQGAEAVRLTLVSVLRCRRKLRRR